MTMNTDWMEEAKCKGMDTNKFFIEDRGIRVSTMNLPCNSCPVRDDCLEYALELHLHHGVYGGYSYIGRRHIRQVRNKQKRLDAQQTT